MMRLLEPIRVGLLTMLRHLLLCLSLSMVEVMEAGLARRPIPFRWREIPCTWQPHLVPSVPTPVDSESHM
jgi:hypothetical protein